MPQATVTAILEEAAVRLAPPATARRDAELLLLRAAGRDRAWLLAHGDAEIAAEQRAQFDAWVERRARHEPVQYILGEQEFYGLAMRVTPAVLIPRPETEHVVEAALGKVPRADFQNQALRICDVGTGSGAIAVALAHALPRAQVTAVDLSEAALEVARENAKIHGVAERVRFVESDLLSAVAGERFDWVVANPPYVAEDEELEAQVREWEPHAALFAGATGLEVYERLIPQAWEALATRTASGAADSHICERRADVGHPTLTEQPEFISGGWLVLEMGHGQREALARLLRGWDEIEFVADLQGIPRVAMARRGGGE
jgi:release factor glutamine methyltransferase